MIHLMLQYAEVYSDLNFIAVPTVPMELRAGVDKGSKDTSESCKEGNLPDIIHREIITDEWRQHTDTENLILDDIKRSNISTDKISQFSVRPPELRYIIDQVGNYYRWFKILPKKLDEDKIRNKLSNNVYSSSWIDGMQRLVLLRKKAIPELHDYIVNKMHHHDRENEHIQVMIQFFEEYCLDMQS